MGFIKVPNMEGKPITINTDAILYYFPTYKYGSDRKCIQIVMKENGHTAHIDVALPEAELDRLMNIISDVEIYYED